MRMFYIGLGFASMLLIALAVYIFIPTPATTDHKEHAVRVIPLTKGDRLPIATPTPTPVIVPTIVMNEQSPLPPVPEVKQAQTLTPPHKPDLCERHHMRKVIINGGRSWRCRK
jgi:hypothetical protein